MTEFVDYLRALVKYRRSHPSGAPNDVLSTLTALHDRGELREAELLHNCIFLLNAGHETTTNLIGNGVHCLLTEPGAREQLRERPASIKGAIEETLRFASPNQLGNREVSATTQIGGVSFEPGTQITLCIGAANRDAAQFDEPERFDIERTPIITSRSRAAFTHVSACRSPASKARSPSAHCSSDFRHCS